jgi:hypothetical protein
MKFLLPLMFLPSFSLACDFVVDTYTTVSESEWKQTLAFAENGEIAITLEQWTAGRYDERKVTTTQATWSCQDSEIALVSEAGSETLLYSARTSLASIGDKDSFLPGLWGSCTGGDCKFAGLYFWEADALRQRYP